MPPVPSGVEPHLGRHHRRVSWPGATNRTAAKAAERTPRAGTDPDPGRGLGRPSPGHRRRTGCRHRHRRGCDETAAALGSSAGHRRLRRIDRSGNWPLHPRGRRVQRHDRPSEVPFVIFQDTLGASRSHRVRSPQAPGSGWPGLGQREDGIRPSRGDGTSVSGAPRRHAGARATDQARG